jgi:aromatic ring hydroxylase
MMVLPTRDIREEESDYAVAFAVPVATNGIRYISRPPDISREKREIERPIRRKYGRVENLVVFDDVFVPHERVFLCGESDMAASAVLGFANIHRGNSKCGCKSGQLDMMIGAAALIADYNGLAKAAIIRDKLAEMVMTAEIGYSCGIAAAVDGRMHPSGEFMINFLQANVGKYLASAEIGEDFKLLQDIGGGLVVTMPTEKDFRHPVIGEDMDKYLKGRDGVPTEHRIRAFKLIEDLTASAFSGWLMGISLNGAGSPMAEKIEAMRNYDLKKRLAIVKELAGII